MQNVKVTPILDRLISENECAQITGLCRTTRWTMERKNQFPVKRKIGTRKVVWLLSEVQNWMHSLESAHKGAERNE